MSVDSPRDTYAKIEAIDAFRAILVVTHPRHLQLGHALRVDWTPPGGEPLRLLGIVDSLASSFAGSGQRLGVSWRGLDEHERRALFRSQFSAQQASSTAVLGRVTPKSLVTYTPGRLSVSLFGALNEREAKLTNDMVETVLPADRPLQSVCIDARGFSACPEPALEWMRRWLGRLAKHASLLGVLVGGNTVGMMQLQRLARIVGLAEQLLVCNDMHDAEATLAVLDGHPIEGE